MPFKKGQGKIGGRTKGTVNKVNATVKERVLSVFNELQNDPNVNLYDFGRKYPREFYQIAAKLIPTEVSAGISITGIKSLTIEPIRSKDSNK